jgi:NADPH:quinone reductase-like Zn-dependent oxidoreductase
MTVIATASPHNFDYLKSLGAEIVFDYRSPTCASDIKQYTKNKLELAWDCMGTGVEICATAMSDAETGVYGTINPADEKLLKEINPKLDGPRFTIGYDAFGETYVWMGEEVAPKPDELEFATAFFEMSEGLLDRGIIKPIRPIVNKTGMGLDGALKGLDELRANKVSGTRLVYTL